MTQTDISKASHADWRTVPRRVWFALGCAVLAALVRVCFLDEGLWIDEVQSVDTAHKDLGLLLVTCGFADVHPPFYYLLLKVWTAFGGGDVAARGLSLVFGSGTVGLFAWWVSGRFRMPSVVLGCVFLILSTFHIHYSVEVRSYALFTFLCLALIIVVERWRDGGRERIAWWVVTLEILLAMTHYYGLLVLVAANLFVLCGSGLARTELKRWLVGQGIVLVALSLWLPMMLVQIFDLPAAFTAHLTEGPPLDQVLAVFGPSPAFSPLWVGALLGAGVLILGLKGGVLHAEISDHAVHTEDSESAKVVWNPMGLGRLACGFGVLACFLPTLVTLTLPLSDTMGDLALDKCAWASGLTLAAGLGLVGLALMRPSRWRLLRRSMVFWVWVSAVVFIGVSQSFRPTLSIRNLLFLVPLVAFGLVKATSEWRAWWVAGVTCVLAVFSLVALVNAPFDFEPRADFRGAMAILEAERETTVLMASKYDLGAMAHYAGPPCQHTGEFLVLCPSTQGHDYRLRILGVDDVVSASRRVHVRHLILLSRVYFQEQAALFEQLRTAHPNAQVTPIFPGIRGLSLLEVRPYRALQ
jgi:hypothetical protein